MPAEPKSESSVTFRAVLIGLAFIPVNVYLVVQLETVWGIGDPTTMTFFFQRNLLPIPRHCRESTIQTISVGSCFTPG
jgi:hypothetical protein